MGIIVEIKDNGEIVGPIKYELAHPKDSSKKGKRHLTSNVFIFRDSSLTEIALTERTLNLASGGKISICIGGHNNWIDYLNRGETPFETVQREIQEEVFYNSILPKKLEKIVFVSSFLKDLRINDSELVTLYAGIYPGPFFPDDNEVKEIYFKNINSLQQDIQNNPEKYVKSAGIFLDHLLLFKNILNFNILYY